MPERMEFCEELRLTAAIKLAFAAMDLAEPAALEAWLARQDVNSVFA